MSTRHDDQQALLQALQTVGTHEALRQADQLRALYHARETAGLSHDVYAAARGTGSPPAGWRRASEHIDLLRATMPGLGTTDAELRDMLTPEGSGFRAEIYLPDPEVLGPGYKPTVVFKGSAHQVRMPDGTLRATATEDFIGNNFPQSIGLKTDYYDRAMDLAVALKQQGLEFDLSGHSLGGGMASAAAAVTGMRAVTHNAAGLHPETARRFSDENGGLPLYDTNAIVTAWQVRGDLLNDGVQGDLRSMDALQRARIATLVSTTIDALERTPAGRELLEQRLVEGMPERSRAVVREFLDVLQQGDAASLIRDLPQAAGDRRPPLVAMTREERELVARDEQASLGELQLLAGPVLAVATMGARGANAGAAVGQVVAEGGRVLGAGYEGAGDLARAGVSGAAFQLERSYVGTGAALNHGAWMIGEVTAHARMAGAQIDAAIDQGQGLAQHGIAQARASALRGAGQLAGLFSDTWREDIEARAQRIEADGTVALQRNQQEAAAALAQGRSDAQARREAAATIGQGLQSSSTAAGAQARDGLVYVGEQLDAGLTVIGTQITATTSHAPTLGAGLGGTTGVLVGGAVTFNPQTPQGLVNLHATVQLVREAGPGVAEALARHGMDSAVIASLDRHVATHEDAARRLLQQARQERGDGREAALPDAHAALRATDTGAAVERLLAAARQDDAGAMALASSALLATTGAKDWLADGRMRAAAIERDADATAGERATQAQAHAASVDTAPGR